MSIVEHTSNLHHPRPTVARVSTSNNSGSSVIRPGIQYPVTLVQRPHAPAPSSPDVRIIHNHTNGHAYTSGEPNLWKIQPGIPTPERYNSTSPTVTRRSARSGSDATSPTYVDEHVITYPELNRNLTQAAIQPAVLRQRSASSPEYLKTKGAYGAPPPPPPASASRVDVASAPAIKPRVTRTNTGNVHFTPGKNCRGCCIAFASYDLIHR
jgi:hypothetical protein